MTIKSLGESDLPRERLIVKGPESLSDAELLAIILSNGATKGSLTAVDCARLLLRAYADFRSLANVPIAELLMLPGIGRAKASRVHAAFEIAKRMAMQKRQKGRVLRSSQDVSEIYSLIFRDETREIFTVILLDAKNRFLRDVRISLGSLNYSLVHPRDVFYAAIRETAAALILMHNHPSGDPTPSQEDMDLTERLEQAGRILGIRVLDHVILGDGKYHSFCDHGRIGKAGYRS